MGHRDIKYSLDYSCSYELISSTIGLSVVEIWVLKVSPNLVFGVRIYSSKMKAPADNKIDDDIHLLHVKKHEHALNKEKVMATTTNNHDVPMEIMMLPMAMDQVDVDEDDTH